MTHLDPIPFIVPLPGEEPALAALRHAPEKLDLLLASARRTYTPLGVRVADALSRRWARRVASPYEGAISQVDRVLGRPGAFLLNHSYEWGCTTGVVADPALGGPTLLRVLDWPFDGLGRAVVATRCAGPAGPYVSLTWPGHVGVLTACAPGRFAAAINQPPLPTPWGKAVGWPTARWHVGRSTALPPSHLLRLVFDRCASFDDAVSLLRTMPICIPTIFTVAGARPGEAITIERTQNRAHVCAEPAAANHWASPDGPTGRPRNRSSRQRRADMLALARRPPDWSMKWLAAPILHDETRLSVMANAASGRLIAQGFEATGPATALTVL
ncbi:hypothetical protein EYW49_12940 [Siculibacillus lacustris]|uniref:Peptidase C45 hydrolase domain-containing protein n=1 Tax=Siculibacillus lacustris TaxID=1549641 RepID=A0A4Q9VN59_9HYPH|nr:carcinine hydrolase/isopenicillin-N N-acyltransferase family protein [Siculibacillus lacustris]TBW37049.1 hypothetical protein EYW49_12940 [Siculibacillus lacustris]